MFVKVCVWEFVVFVVLSSAGNKSHFVLDAVGVAADSHAFDKN